MPKDIEVIMAELVRRMNEHGRRIRSLEERSSLIEGRLRSMQDTILRNTEDRKNQLNKINEKLKELNTDMLKINNELLKVNKNLERTARKSQIKELESLISMFNPLKSKFITREEVKRLLKR